MEKISHHDLHTVEHSYSYLIKKDDELFGKYLLKDEYIHLAVFDKIVDINTIIYAYFKSIRFKHINTYISYFYMETKAHKFFNYNNNSLTLNFDDVIKHVLCEIIHSFDIIYEDLKIDNDNKLNNKYTIVFDKNVWIFMKTYEKRKMKLNQLNI